MISILFNLRRWFYGQDVVCLGECSIVALKKKNVDFGVEWNILFN